MRARPLAISAAGKLAAFPLAVPAASAAFGPEPRAACVAPITGAAPTGMAAGKRRGQHGGGAALMAAIITVRTPPSFVVMPNWRALSG
jgi:predicted permease